MNILLGIGAAIGLYMLLEKQQRGIVSRTISRRRPVRSGAPGQPGLPGFNFDPSGSGDFSSPGDALASGSLGLAGTGFGSAVAATGGASSSLAFLGAATVPVVGAVVAGVGFALSAVFKHHQEAVQREGKTIINAVPRVLTLINETVRAYNAGMVDQATAVAYLQKALDLYYQEVQKVPMKGKVPKAGVWNDGKGSTPLPNPCNGPCTVAFYWLEPGANQIAQTIARGQRGTISIGPIPPAHGFPSAGQVTVQITRKAAPLPGIFQHPWALV